MAAQADAGELDLDAAEGWRRAPVAAQVELEPQEAPLRAADQAIPFLLFVGLFFKNCKFYDKIADLLFQHANIKAIHYPWEHIAKL